MVAEFAVFLFLLDHVERELFDLCQELGFHFADAHALLFHFIGGWDIGQMVIGFDIGGDFGEWLQFVARIEDVVGAGGGDEDFLSADCAGDL